MIFKVQNKSNTSKKPKIWLIIGITLGIFLVTQILAAFVVEIGLGIIHNGEILVRGYLYSGLRSNWKFLPAALLTSLMFGLAHLQLGSGAAVVWAAGIDTFVLSMVLVYLREKTGVLYAGILVHALNNLIAFGVHFNH
jgi:membrane protease YdiL (CAAX protease family)